MEVDREIKVSVIIPVYNVEKYLKKCVDSVLAQDYSKYEILLIDDGSTDSSGKICDEYAERYQKIKVIHQKNKGLGGARNTGIDNAIGKYLIFVDSDDYLEVNALSSLINKAEENNADLVICNSKTVTTSGKKIRETNFSLPDAVFNLDSYKDLIFIQVSAWGKIYKKSIFIKNNIRFPEKYWFEDIWVTYDIFLNSDRVVKCDNVLYNYVMREGSIMNSKNIERNMEILKAYDSVRDMMKKYNVWEIYHDEMEYLVINNLYLGTSIRILMCDAKTRYLDDIQKYMHENYAGFMKNKYLKKNKIEYVICRMLKLHMYRTVKVLTLLKRRVEGYVIE